MKLSTVRQLSVYWKVILLSQKPKKKVNRPDLAKFGEENTLPGDNARYLRHAMVSLDLPPIDISDPDQVNQRIHDYFSYCIENDRKPNMIGMANWIGVNKDTIRSWKIGECRSSTHSALIKKAVNVLEELWYDYMQNGKVNPASGIFLGKNTFGYRDSQDIVVTPANPMGEELSQKELESRINEVPIGDGDYEVE